MYKNDDTVITLHKCTHYKRNGLPDNQRGVTELYIEIEIRQAQGLGM